MKILVDETSDGWVTELKMLGYDAHSVRELKKKEEKLGHDFNVISYAQENKMILVTKDRENGEACEANSFPCVFINDETVFKKMVLAELEKFKS